MIFGGLPRERRSSRELLQRGDKGDANRPFAAAPKGVCPGARGKANRPVVLEVIARLSHAGSPSEPKFPIWSYGARSEQRARDTLPGARTKPWQGWAWQG